MASATALRVRSYASDSAPRWTLFVRQQQESRANGSAAGSESVFVFTAVVPSSGVSTSAIYEKRLDLDAIEQHIEELGVEVKAPAFIELLLETLEMRKAVAVVIDEEEDEKEDGGAVSVVLTYKFSETISRKGQVVLDCVSKDVPLAVAMLLQDIHAVQSESVMTEPQKLQRSLSTASARQAKRESSSTATSLSSSTSMSLSQESNLSTDGEAAVAPTMVSAASASAVNPQLLKRRHVPTGTVRRKGPRGAKLAKTE